MQFRLNLQPQLASHLVTSRSDPYHHRTDKRYRGRYTDMHEELVNSIIEALEKSDLTVAVVNLHKYGGKMLDFSFSVSTMMRGIANITVKMFDLFQRSLPFKIMLTLLGLSIVAKRNLSEKRYTHWHAAVCEVAEKCNKQMGLTRVSMVFGATAYMTVETSSNVLATLKHLKKTLTDDYAKNEFPREIDDLMHNYVPREITGNFYDMQPNEKALCLHFLLHLFRASSAVKATVLASFAYIYAGVMGTALRRLFDKTDYDTIVETLLTLGATGESEISMPKKLLPEVPYSLLRSTLSSGQRAEGLRKNIPKGIGK